MHGSSTQLDSEENSGDDMDTGSSDGEGQNDKPVEEGVPDATNPLLVDRLCWEHEPNGVPECWRDSTGRRPHKPGVVWPASFSREPTAKKTILRLDYFIIMFPNMIDEICDWTSKNLEGKEVTQHEFLKFLGLTGEQD